MNKITISALSILVLLGLFAVPVPNATNAAGCERTITGYVITNGQDTNARFRYATDYSTVDSGGGNTTSIQTVSANQDQNIEARLTNLSSNTRYFYQLEIKWTNQSSWTGVDIENFVTDSSCGGGEPPVTIVNFEFTVKNSCDSRPIQGADVHIGQNFGNGQDRTTDGNGFSNFGVNSNTNISWNVSA